MEIPITRFDGYDLGEFDETDKQQTDTYTTSRVPRWYGWFWERKNDRTNFVNQRHIDFTTLREGIHQRLNSIITSEEFARLPGTIGDTEYRNMLRPSEREYTSTNMLGRIPFEITEHTQLLSAINEISIVTTIDRYAYRAPPENKLQAGIEFAVWQIRQPVGTNRANALVRSGAATFLDTWKYRGI